MTTLPSAEGVMVDETVEAKPGVSASVAGLTPSDLGELMAAFNEVTTKLEASHETLRAEVSRLNGELQAANERLDRSRRLAELGEMAAGIAHELRNPLASIGLYARMLEQDLPTASPTGENAGKIASAVRRMDAIVTDVLAFAREDRVRCEPVEVGAILRSAGEVGREAAERCSAEAGRGSPRIGVLVEPAGAGVPATVPCDPSLFHQALANVVTNAVQAACESGKGSHDSVVCGVRVGRELDADGRRVEMLGVWVRDRGPGLPPDVRSRMFNPFFTTRAAGTGLGLAIVHRIVDAHGGRVRAENNSADLGGGATVELLLPLESAVDSHRGRAMDGAVLSEPTLSLDEDLNGALGRTEASE